MQSRLLLPGLTLWATLAAAEPAALLFHANFDGGLDASMAKGAAKAMVSGRVALVEGHAGKGVSIEAKGFLSYVAAGNLLPGRGSVCFWFKPLAPVQSRAGWDRLFDIHGATDKENCIRIHFMKGAPKLYAALASRVRASLTSFADVSDWSAGRWRHVAFTWDGASARLYLDGGLVAHTVDPVLPEALESAFYLGSRKEGGEESRGVFDELRVYSGPLAGREVAALAGLDAAEASRVELLNEAKLRYLDTPLVTFRISGPLPPPPSRVSERFPLSDQENRGGWALVDAFSDEFTGARMDASKWSNTIDSWGQWEWRAENTWHENGFLKVRMLYTNLGNGRYYTSGTYRSLGTIRYGYFECRMKGSTVNPGTCPAFWLFCNDADRWTEIDWLELGQQYSNKAYQSPANVLDYTLHLFKHPRFHNPSQAKGQVPGHYQHSLLGYEAPFNPSEGFHVYGGLWTPTEISIFLDGVKLVTRTNDYWDQPLWLILSMGVRNPYLKQPSGEGFPALWEIDYVRTWKNAATRN
ncbi:MAG: laminin G domain-containing protein [Spirochaetes bacterium]|nr:laminin G domain-containing protein [Spirochaetota bacterium]